MAKLSRTRSAGLLPRWLGRPLSWIARLLYNVSTSGLENLPECGGVLLVANHMSYVDGVVLQLACPRPVRFVGDDDYRRSHWFARRIFRLTGTIPLGPRSTLSGTRRILAALQAGEVVCMFPEGGISRTGQLMDLRPGYDWLAHRAGVPVLPVGHDGLWGS
nr:1-acyl-sn-glycerol-3-phosphate acyltransferase [Opitutaceae bacterium]